MGSSFQSLPKSPVHDLNDGHASKGRTKRTSAYPKRFAAAYSYIWTRQFALIAAPVAILGLLAISVTYTWLRRNSSPFGWDMEPRFLSSKFGALQWLSGSADTFEAPQLPPDFDWRAYLKWNPELELEHINTQEGAERHYVREGYMKNLVYRDFELTIRYTACGGLMNQHYCHIAAIALAHLCHAKRLVWPPMQERKSFHMRYHPDARKNEQEWVYLDASTLWDLPHIQDTVRDSFGIEIVKHPEHVQMPNMTQLETAFQTYDPSDKPYQSELRFRKPIYLARHNPYMLARAIMDAGRQVVLKHGRQPESVLVDLPCTLFMMDNRNLTVIEDIARLLQFSPRISALADKVVSGISAESGSREFNGVHLRMERDAMDWAMILGGRNRYWALYRSSMSMAHFSKNTPLFVASGLLKGSTNINELDGTTQGDNWSVQQMKQLAREVVSSKLASKVVHKEMYLDQTELADVSNEQSGLIDLLVLRRSWRLVGISVSTFSFYLGEMRLMDGHDQEDTVMLDAYRIGTDELFYSCAIAATRTRLELARQGVLRDGCKRPSGRACWEPMG